MPGPFTDRGVLDRREIAAHRVKLVLAQTPTIIDNQAFTTGQIKRSGGETVLPNTLVEFGVKNGVGCDMKSAAELQGKIMPDEHVHEHATCFNLKDRGLIVISSCGHVGIVNSVRQAQEVSGVQKVHAIDGWFPPGAGAIGVSQSGRGRYQEAGTDVVILGAVLLCLSPTSLRAQKEPERSAAELMDVLMWNRELVGGPFALVDIRCRRCTWRARRADCLGRRRSCAADKAGARASRPADTNPAIRPCARPT